MGAYFITATGTGVGKTLLTCALTWKLGAKAGAVKPVISGFDEKVIEASDTGQILSSLGKPATLEEAQKISPWRFTAPLSPDIAAAREGRRILLQEVADWCRDAAAQHSGDAFLVEGVGGVMTPLDHTVTQLDLMLALGMPAIVVCGSYLGSISHTLTACAALQQAGVAIHAVVVSESGEDTDYTAAVLRTLQSHLGAGVALHLLPRVKSVDATWKRLPDEITEIIGV